MLHVTQSNVTVTNDVTHCNETELDLEKEIDLKDLNTSPETTLPEDFYSGKVVSYPKIFELFLGLKSTSSF